MRNLTRWQQVDQFSLVNQPQGTWCVETGINPWTGAACAAPRTFSPNRGGTARDTTNEILVNQTDFTVELATGAIEHTLVSGVSFSAESYHRDNGNALRNPLGATPNPALPVMSILNPDHVYTGPVNFIVTQRADGEVKNRAAYVFDRVATDRALRDQRRPSLRAQRCFEQAREHRRAVSSAARSTRRDAEPGRRATSTISPRIASASCSSRARAPASTSHTVTPQRRR